MTRCIYCRRELSNSLEDLIQGADNIEVGSVYDLKNNRQGSFCNRCWEAKLAKQIVKARDPIALKLKKTYNSWRW